MGTVTDSLFSVLMGWVRGLVDALWALFSSDHTTALEFFGKNWLLIAGVIIAAGLVIDWVIWLLRWQPYHLWAQRARRLLRIEEPEGEEEEPARAHAAALPLRPRTYPEPARAAEALREDAAMPGTDFGDAAGEELHPVEAPYADETPYSNEARFAEEQQVMERARNTPDEYAYPGMRYDSTARQRDTGSTQRYGAVTQEGPGAAEVQRRRAEINAWQQQMQEEARAEAARAAYEAAQARLAQEAREAEHERRQQEAYEAEQARLAQAEYERQMEEYRRQCAQYERDLAEYERQKAAYDAQTAHEAMGQEQADELSPNPPAGKRKRKAYSDDVQGDTVSDLPEMPQMADAVAQTSGKARKSILLERVSRMLEEDEEELAVRTKLPPRVDMKDAYRPAAVPKQNAPRELRGRGRAE